MKPSNSQPVAGASGARVFVLLECFCDDEGDWIAGVFSSIETAKKAMAADAEMRAAKNTHKGLPLAESPNYRSKTLRIVEMELDRHIPPEVRNRSDRLHERVCS
jgi:hypothetical protein